MTATASQFESSLEMLTLAIKEFTNSRENSRQLREILDSTIAEGGICFSTLGQARNEHFIKQINKLESTPSPYNRLNSSNLVLITRGAMATQYGYKTQKSVETHNGNNYLIHILTHLRCQVFENFFMTLHGESEQILERINLGNERVSLRNSDKHFLINNRQPVLYSLAIANGYLTLYANGLQKCKVALREVGKFSSFSFGLLGKQGSTSEASVLALYIGSGSKLIENKIFEVDKNLEKTLDQLLDDRNLRESVRCIYLNEIKLDPRTEKVLLDVFKEELNEKPSFQDWLINYLDGFVSDNFMEKYRELSGIRANLEMVKALNVTVELFRNPHKALHISRLFQRTSPNNSFSLFNGLSLELFKGDRLGVIGSNGAGKTTLLRTLAGLIPISTGELLLKGNYMLLKAGVGMRAALTGRENIYHAGSYLGLWGKELDNICAEIIEFSELGDSIDRPYKYYSDGMKSRLVFSLATSVKPNILMLDELLSAGDISFKRKAEIRLASFLNEIDIVIVVTHGINYVANNCNKALYISAEHDCFFGDPERAISLYLEELRQKSDVGFIDSGDSLFLDN